MPANPSVLPGAEQFRAATNASAPRLFRVGQLGQIVADLGPFIVPVHGVELLRELGAVALVDATTVDPDVAEIVSPCFPASTFDLGSAGLCFRDSSLCVFSHHIGNQNLISVHPWMR